MTASDCFSIYKGQKREIFQSKLTSAEKMTLIENCLKYTGCPMGYDQIREYIKANNNIYLTNDEVKHHVTRSEHAVRSSPTSTAFQWKS